MANPTCGSRDLSLESAASHGYRTPSWLQHLLRACKTQQCLKIPGCQIPAAGARCLWYWGGPGWGCSGHMACTSRVPIPLLGPSCSQCPPCPCWPWLCVGTGHSPGADVCTVGHGKSGHGCPPAALGTLLEVTQGLRGLQGLWLHVGGLVSLPSACPCPGMEMIALCAQVLLLCHCPSGAGWHRDSCGHQGCTVLSEPPSTGDPRGQAVPWEGKLPIMARAVWRCL